MDELGLEQLSELYDALHLASERAAASLRLAARPGAPREELLERFRGEAARVAAIWSRIREVEGG